MTICCIPYCKSRSGITKNVSFFEFPSNIPLRELWLKNISRENWLPNDRDKVCSLHFKDGDIRDGLKVRRLVNDAVPTVFPKYPKYIQSKIIKASQPKRNPPRTRDLVPQKMEKKIEIKENDKDDCNSNITTQEGEEGSLLTSFNISSPNLTQSFCANCVNCNANLRYRNRFDWTNRLAFPNWKFNLPRVNELPLMKIPVSDAIRFIYEVTVNDLIRVGLTADNSKYGCLPSFDDVFVCKQCGDILSELYCAHRKLKYISDAEGILRKAIKYKNLQPDVKNESNNNELQMEELDFFEETDGIDSEMQSQEDQDPLADHLFEKHLNTVECIEPTRVHQTTDNRRIESSVVSLNVTEINTFIPVVRLERLKSIQFPAGDLKACPIIINSEERCPRELATSGIQEQTEDYAILEAEESNNRKIRRTLNKVRQEKLTDLSLEIGKEQNTIDQNIEMDSMQRLIEKNKAKKFTCDCGHKSSTSSLLRRHIRDVHYFRCKFRCGICARSFKVQRYLIRHQKLHSEKNHVCGVCGKTFTIYRYLLSHHKIRHPTHVLPKKPKRISTTKSFNVKLERKNKQSPKVKDSTKKKRSKSIMSINKSTKESNSRDPGCSYLCTTCGRTLSSKYAFEDHMRLHTGERPFKCNELDCEMTFRTLLNLKVHKANVHVNDFSFPCKIEGCDRKFKLYGALRSHCYSQHPRLDKMFICDICGKPFKFKKDLERHLRTHEELPSSEKRKFKCEHCERRFADKSELKLHVKVVHTKEISFVCEECGKSCSNSRSLRNHKRVHSGEKPYKCEQCNKQWASHAGLWWHQKHSHLHKT